MNGRRVLAWCVHFYTALGLVAAAGIAVSIFHGKPADFRLAFALMVVACIIDATDGTLARRVRVKEVVPSFDGARLDDLIDFQTYTSLPLLLIWRAELLGQGATVWLLVPLLASAYGFCQTKAKTDDGYFLGFPSYWNVIAFYLYVLQPPSGVAITITVAFALLTFVPARYLYPTHRGRLNRLTNQLGAIWGALLVYVLWRLPVEESAGIDAATQYLALGSLVFPLYYLLVSWAITARIVMRARRQHAIMEMEKAQGI